MGVVIVLPEVNSFVFVKMFMYIHWTVQEQFGTNKTYHKNIILFYCFVQFWCVCVWIDKERQTDRQTDRRRDIQTDKGGRAEWSYYV